MGKITEALKKVADERIARIQKKPQLQYVIKKVENTRIDEHAVSFHDPTSPLGEQYKILRTNIQSLKQTKGFRTFVISSAIHGEGKSMTAINLAISMAHDLNNKGVLLVDADMRKGRVAKYLGLDSSPGLSELLNEKAEPNEVFLSPSIENLSVITAGKTPHNPAELLSSARMRQLLTTFKNMFDFVFIDTPPIMPLTDACILGPLADGVIFAIQAGRTQREVIHHAESRLYQAQAKALGYVITNVEYHLPRYMYRYIVEYSDYVYKSAPYKNQPVAK